MSKDTETPEQEPDEDSSDNGDHDTGYNDQDNGWSLGGRMPN